jgi:hypothetical protein
MSGSRRRTEWEIICLRKGNPDRQTHSVKQVIGQAGNGGFNAIGRPHAAHSQPHGRVNEEVGGYRRRDAIDECPI